MPELADLNLCAESSDNEKDDTIDTTRHNRLSISKLKKALLELKNSKEAYKAKFHHYYSISKKLVELNKQLEQDNNKLAQIIKSMESEITEKAQLYEKELETLKRKFRSQLIKVSRQALEKELEYKARIKSMDQNLHECHELMGQERQNHKKEKEEIKQKISELIN